MAVIETNQYRPVTTLESADNDALSVRYVRDTADNINNTRAFAFRGKLVSEIFLDSDWCSNVDSSTAENVVRIFPPVYLPANFDGIQWQAGGRLLSQPGGVTCTWRLYCSSSLYGPGGPLIMNTSLLSGNFVVSALAAFTDGSNNEIPNPVAMPAVRDRSGYSWLVLTAQHSTGSGAAKAYLTSLDVVGVAG